MIGLLPLAILNRPWGPIIAFPVPRSAVPERRVTLAPPGLRTWLNAPAMPSPVVSRSRRDCGAGVAAAKAGATRVRTREQATAAVSMVGCVSPLVAK
ncbi:hypothetical protein [Nonomuraea sp. NEAU-A123]|uniref:hypothetical protein n=1 Tax=Nonomuraea sp. NEAU-A123 TaxID=2839649 RepID=UPI002032E737|nr:hypothetical protein [Nonomuraea sp. NEAU-A123]